ncbi:MAG: protein kinase [Lentisphaeria bacterium]|nr:protein kinase [Lentisphaeria bacterium]
MNTDTQIIDIKPKLKSYQIREYFYSNESCHYYDGYERNSQKPVIIKQLRKRFKDNHEQKNIFIQVQQLLQQINSSFVANILDIDPENATVVLDWYTGETLFEKRTKEFNMDRDLAVQFVVQICEMLEQLYDYMDFYGNINAHNLCIDYNNLHAKFDDLYYGFGVRDPARVNHPNFQIYLAPELLDGQSFSPQTDQYALAVLLYNLIHGKSPCTLQAIEDELSYFSDVMAKATRLDPSKRYKSICEFKNALINAHKVHVPSWQKSTSKVRKFISTIT